MPTAAQVREEMNKKKTMEGGLGEAVYYIDGSVGAGKISLVFEKEFAKAYAKGLLDAAENAPEGARDVGMELDVKLVPKNKIFLHEKETVQ